MHAATDLAKSIITTVSVLKYSVRAMNLVCVACAAIAVYIPTGRRRKASR